MKRSVWLLVPAVALLALLVPLAAGAAGAPALAFAPSANGTFDFAAVSPGQTASQTLTLTNSGGKASGALTISLSGSGAFTKTADGCTATSLGPNKSCSVTIQYAPTTAGQSDSATLSASSKKPAASASLSLTGSGAAQPVPTHDVFLDKVTTGGTAPSGSTQFTFTVECESGVETTPVSTAPNDAPVLVADDVAQDDLCTITEIASQGATSTTFQVTGGSVQSTTANSVTFSVDGEVSVVATNAYPEPSV